MSKYNRPFYQKLYADLIREKHPEKHSLCADLLQKKEWIVLDVIRINNILFGKSTDSKTKKHRAYDTASILKILRYQYDNNLSHKDISKRYGTSRNTIAKWNKLYADEIEYFK